MYPIASSYQSLHHADQTLQKIISSNFDLLYYFGSLYLISDFKQIKI